MHTNQPRKPGNYINHTSVLLAFLHLMDTLSSRKLKHSSSHKLLVARSSSTHRKEKQINTILRNTL